MNNYLKILDYLKQYYGDGQYYEFEFLLENLDKKNIKNIAEGLNKDNLIDIDSRTGRTPFTISYSGDPFYKPPRYIPFKGRLTLKGFNHLNNALEMKEKKGSTTFSNINNSQIVVQSTNTNINIGNIQNQPEIIDITRKIVETLKSDNTINEDIRHQHLQLFQTLLIQAQNGQIDKETGKKALTVGDSVSSIGSFLLSLSQALLPNLIS